MGTDSVEEEKGDINIKSIRIFLSTTVVAQTTLNKTKYVAAFPSLYRGEGDS